MADHELNAGDTEPPWEGYLDYEGVPAKMPDGSTNPDLPPLDPGATLTWVQRNGSTVITGPVDVVDAAARHVRHRFRKSETSAPGDWFFQVQEDIADASRPDGVRTTTHPLGAPKLLLIHEDQGGPA